MALSENPDVTKLREALAEAAPGSIVFFGGAGVSTESGIPDFRSPDGLYAQKYKYPPEMMLSRTFFDEHPADFFDFYFDKVVFLGAKPNQAHLKLAELEREGKLIDVVTQNIDGLHQAAGSKRVLELHGSIMRNYCMDCGHFADLEGMLKLREEALSSGKDGIPRCPSCGSIMKPDVVLYEEPLDQRILQASVEAINRADIMLIAGTSLAVNPAASLVDFFHGNLLAIVNRTPTPQDGNADVVISESIGEVLDF